MIKNIRLVKHQYAFIAFGQIEDANSIQSISIEKYRAGLNAQIVVDVIQAYEMAPRSPNPFVAVYSRLLSVVSSAYERYVFFKLSHVSVSECGYLPTERNFQNAIDFRLCWYCMDRVTWASSRT